MSSLSAAKSANVQSPFRFRSIFKNAAPLPVFGSRTVIWFQSEMRITAAAFNTAKESFMKSGNAIYTMAIVLSLMLGTPIWLPAQNQPAGYVISNLGTLGGAASAGNAINTLGWVIGVANLPGDQTAHATLWRNGAKIDLGTLGGPNSAVDWPVHNDRGMIAGISETSALDPMGETWSCRFFFPSQTGHTCRGFVWQNGVMTALPTLGGNNGYAAGMNNLDQVVGWAETPVHDPTCNPPQVLQFEAVLYGPAPGQIQVLSPLTGDPDSAATAINNRAQAIGISGLCANAVGGLTAQHAVLWQDGIPTDIGNLGGAAWNTPTAINNAGAVVGFSDLPGDENGQNINFHAFLWTKQGGIRDLGALPGDTISEALGINDHGQVVGESCTDNTFANCRAFLWQNGAMVDLNSLTAPGSPFLIFANDINNRGEIAGEAFIQSTGEAPAFLAVPSR
jgi:probable HAF family extracellular repeat protein